MRLLIGLRVSEFSTKPSSRDTKAAVHEVIKRCQDAGPDQQQL
jgi:hypothetical protein